MAYAKFDTTEEEMAIIKKIAKRAHEMAQKVGVTYELQDIQMDITATHCNGCPLQLQALLDAPDFDFAHDIQGIRRHLDRKTGHLVNLWLPRTAGTE